MRYYRHPDARIRAIKRGEVKPNEAVISGDGRKHYAVMRCDGTWSRVYRHTASLDEANALAARLDAKPRNRILGHAFYGARVS